MTPASCASLRIRSSRPEKITAKPVGNIIALKSGMSRQIDPEVLGRRTADLADQVLEIAGQLRVVDQQVRAGDLLLDPLHLLPQALLVLVGRSEAGTDQRDHVGGRTRACATPV